MKLKNIVYALACLSFAIVIGGAVYEHMVVVPKWAAAPPVSLSMFQGEYGLDPSLFWMIIHPVTLLLFITALVLCWRSKARLSLLVTFGIYFLILVITRIYFVPELISITGTTFSDELEESLTQRAQLWETLSLIRLGVLIIISVVQLLGLTKVERT